MAIEVITWFDQMPYELACRHIVVLGRLDGKNSWTCADCGTVTNLLEEKNRKRLEHDRDTANQVDARARDEGKTVVRADPNDPQRRG